MYRIQVIARDISNPKLKCFWNSKRVDILKALSKSSRRIAHNGGFLVHTPKAKVSPRVCPRHASNKGLKKLAVLDVRCSWGTKITDSYPPDYGGRVILILMNFWISNFACSQVVTIASLVSELFLFLLYDLSFPCGYFFWITMEISMGKWQKIIFRQ